MICRYCGCECDGHPGQPGYINVCDECAVDHPPIEPARYMAGMSADPDGLEWDIITASARSLIDRAEARYAAARPCGGVSARLTRGMKGIFGIEGLTTDYLRPTRKERAR